MQMDRSGQAANGSLAQQNERNMLQAVNCHAASTQHVMQQEPTQPHENARPIRANSPFFFLVGVAAGLAPPATGATVTGNRF